ncbi:hypothetical protein A3H26_01335 [candidate division WWE3 bacterium RIFCSPLOWO2_12_FULL_36_10]|uniref:Uncharacterized protein n=1 Tax=candidate division WWE3 bacterium RIFCSPLOWO2_12_FULL_36_10 TaxID=1802630 RepID=A0A1F4VKI7_UNCKA|nr:MAG: hypothetical protein A3H26_01335 [candidate division WWE3 bacterium RIFCSPLOWO2_12_FULL_36_10]
MHIEGYDASHVLNLIKESKKIAVVPSRIAGVNSFCAGLGLYRMLQNSGKEAYLIHTGKIPDICKDLIKKDEILSDISQRKLNVSIDYSGTRAQKVHYTTEDDVLHLVVQPVERDFNKDRINVSISGFDFDLIFIIGALDFEDLGGMQRDLENEFRNANIINIDNNEKNKRFGTVNVVDTHAENLSEIIFKRGYEWELIPEKNAAKALLTGMTYRDVWAVEG